MRSVWRRLEWTLPVGAAMLLCGACGSTSTPTAAGAVAATKTEAGATSPTASVLVNGVVVDSANRPVANANVECMGEHVTCTAPGAQVIAQDGPDDGVKTSANGNYAMVVTAPGAAANGVLMSAHAIKYELQMKQLTFPDAACTADQARCAVTLNFTLNDQAQ